MKINFSQKWRYEFDNFMAKGGKSFFLMLLVLFLGCLALFTLFRFVFIFIFPETAGQDSWMYHVWKIFLEMTDPGNMNQDNASSAWLKLTAIIAGMGGVVIFSMLIAFITTELGMILEELKKGRSQVVEDGHTLILGWNERVIEILKELVIANESESYACVVVLADEDKVMMDDVIKASLPNTKTTRVITRHGSTSNIFDLNRVNAKKIKSAIVLAGCGSAASHNDKQVSDLKVIKTILALTQCLGDNKDVPIIADVFSSSHRQLVDIFASNNVLTVDVTEILGKILVQTSRSNGLAVVYNEMLSFDGCELYAYGADWQGIKFYDAIYHFPDGIPLGVKKADGKIILRPENKNEVLEEGDKVIIIAEDDSTINFKKKPVVIPKSFDPLKIRLERKTERQLFLGWHSITPVLIKEFSDYLEEGSQIDIVLKEPSQVVKDKILKAKEQYANLNIKLIYKDPLSYDDLKELNPFGYDNVIILSTSEGENEPEKTDSETIMILLLLRTIRDSLKDQNIKTSIITQIMNSDNDELMSKTNVDDFIISNKLVSMIFAELSEEASLQAVYDDLFSEEGSEVYIKPAHLYFSEFPVKLTFADMISAASVRDEICFGLRLVEFATEADKNFGVKLNPAKDKEYTLTEKDWLVVLAEDEL